jgi:hypothetical protein
VTLRLHLVNTGDRRVDFLVGAGHSAFNFKVTRADRTVVWRRLNTRFIPAAGNRTSLGPGESRTFVDDWSLRDAHGNPVPPGTYYVQGLVYTNLSVSWTPAEPLVITR